MAGPSAARPCCVHPVQRMVEGRNMPALRSTAFRCAWACQPVATSESLSRAPGQRVPAGSARIVRPQERTRAMADMAWSSRPTAPIVPETPSALEALSASRFWNDGSLVGRVPPAVTLRRAKPALHDLTPRWLVLASGGVYPRRPGRARGGWHSKERRGKPGGSLDAPAARFAPMPGATSRPPAATRSRRAGRSAGRLCLAAMRR